MSIGIGIQSGGLSSSNSPAVPEVWIYYVDAANQVIERRKADDSAGTEIETISSNTTVILTGKNYGQLGVDLDAGTSGLILCGRRSGSADELYEIDLSDDSETEIGTNLEWIFSCISQSGQSRWMFSQATSETVSYVSHGGGTPTTYLSGGGQFIAEDVTNDYIVTTESDTSTAVRRLTARLSHSSTTNIETGFAGQGIAIDTDGNAYYYNRSSNLLRKCQYHPSVGTPSTIVDHSSPAPTYGCDGIDVVDGKLYYSLDLEMRRCELDGTSDTLLWNLPSGHVAGARAVLTT